MKEIIEQIKNNNLSYEIKDEKIFIYNIGNNNIIEVMKETDLSDKDLFLDYIVSFATQHWHLDDIEDVLECIKDIINDQILPIEFYYKGEPRFGESISREQFDNLSLSFLIDQYGFSEDYISNYEYEVHSWSGKYDIKKQPITNLQK